MSRLQRRTKNRKLKPSVRLAACRSSRSRSSPRTKRRTSAPRSTRSAWADEIIVVDSQSTDDTVAIARQHTDRVSCATWPGYVAQKNFAASLASHDWILSLDADERVTPALAAEIGRRCGGARARGYPDAARDVASRPLDPHDRLVSGLSAAPLRSPRRAVDRPVRARVGDGATDASAGCAASCSTSPTATSRITSRRSTATRPTRRGRCTRAAAAPACCSSPAIRRSRSSATTSLTRRHSRRRARLDHLVDERVLRVPEVREAVGAARAQDSASNSGLEPRTA